jgi:hypothetical protein
VINKLGVFDDKDIPCILVTMQALLQEIPFGELGIIHIPSFFTFLFSEVLLGGETLVNYTEIMGQSKSSLP